ncbi:MAG: dynamin family protein [Pseudomonadales bacterium]|nr:dynamin family protein [Pseudomonadales bacterium]
MKSPRQVRSDIRTLAHHIDHVREALLRRADVEIAQVGKECKRTSDALAKLLEEQKLPEHYKVAVVGRFKAGKSSFVNELLDARLASEDTNPETAAVTTFRHGDEVKATIRFLSRDEWTKIQSLYQQDPRHIDAHRVLKWHELGKPRKNKDGEMEEGYDLPALEKEYIRDGGFSIEIRLANDGTKKAEAEFRRRLKEFTTGTKPHHCMVLGIEIESPAPILDGGVLLIDTPGLGDTERYRVELTEKVVDEVDAVLFLTRSGASYDQAEKDFLLSLLRKGTVKQLIVVVTQVDVTYQQHLDNAEANDDDPDPVARRIDLERQRLTKELADTLAELSQDDSSAMRRYREQLGDVQIAFTSAKLHRYWKAGKPTPCVIQADDPGGVEKLKSQLLYMLSTESRLALVAQGIAAGARSALLDLQSVLDAKLLAIRDVKDREVAEQKLRSFRGEFGQASHRFEGAVTEQVTLLGQRLEERTRQHGSSLEIIALLAERELVAFELNDVARHWRTRRSGYWGHMADLQTKVANRIFPMVQEMLSEYTDTFAEFARSFEAALSRLSAEGARIAQSLELGTSLLFDVTSKLKDSLEKSLARAQELIVAKELEVNKLLSDFVDDEVSERIDQAREKVSDVWGKGTTVKQSGEVQAFYREVKALLAEALQSYLRDSIQAFGAFLVAEAWAAPRDALAEVNILLEQADDNIRAAAMALVAGQKDAIETLVAGIKAEQVEVLTRANLLIQHDAPPKEQSSAVGDLPERVAAPVQKPSAVPAAPAPRSRGAPVTVPPVPPGVSVADSDWAEAVQHNATVTVARLRLRDGSSGWPFEKVFPSRFLRGAQRARLVDPYLSKPHQIRNLNDFLLHLAESAHPKEIEVVTAFAADEFIARQARYFDEAAKDLFKSFGVTANLRREPGLHDRYLILDHGVLFKLGRGLDIYKPAVGLAEHRSANRKVRQTDVDIFCIAGHALASDDEIDHQRPKQT